MKADNNSNIKQHFFKPGAMSIIQMGEELIGHPSTAINELVKNSYDADATKCKVYFHYSAKVKESFIIVSDNGCGMNDEILFGDWLHPSVSLKRTAKHSLEFKRNFLGSKGIGRLASMALGQFVTVVTRKKVESNYYWITLDRNAFKEKKFLSEITFPGDEIESLTDIFSDEEILQIRNQEPNKDLLSVLEKNKLSSFDKGTIIIIENIDDSIKTILEEEFLTQQSLYDDTLKKTEFYKSLATLITPLNLSVNIQRELMERQVINEVRVISDIKSSFAVDFGINLLPDQKDDIIDWQKIEPIPILSTFDYRVMGKVAIEGDVEGFFIYNRIAGDHKEEFFRISYEEIKNNLLSGTKNNEVSEELFPESRNAANEYYFDIRVYDIGEQENLEKLRKNSGFEKIIDFRNAFKSFQGFRISKNGFGVKPYGEEVKDWINLSEARVQNPGQNVSTNQILGYVFFFSPENDRLEERTNREGFLENTAFIQVKNTLQTIFKNLGRRRYNYRLAHELGRIPSSKHSRPNFDEFLKYVKTNDNIKSIREYSENFLKEVTTSMDNLEESLSFSERLASLGSGIELVYHEMAQPISQLTTTKSSLSLKKDKIQIEAREYYIIDLNYLNDSIIALVELRKSLQPVIGKNRKKLFKPYETFLKVCSLFRSDLIENNIRVVIDKRIEDFELTELEYSFWIAFLNVINNAVYWIKKAGDHGEIRLNLKKDKIIISNSGPPIDNDIIDILFEYGVSGKSEKNATGLGLAYTRSTLGRIDWSISAENNENGPAFTLTKK